MTTDESSAIKNARVLWTAFAGVILAWPFGAFVSLVLGTGQDGLGRALAAGIGDVTTLVIWAVATAAIYWKPRKRLSRMDNRARAVVGLSPFCLPVIAVVVAVNYQDFDLRVWNETGAGINSVAVRMSDKRYSFGAMSSGVTATRRFERGRPRGIAEISWTSDDGRTQTVEVDLSETVPRRYDRGLLTFTIYGEDDVKVGFFIQKRPSF